MAQDKLTASVARLYRASSEHSQETENLRQAANALLDWIKQHVGTGVQLPSSGMLYPSGQFVAQLRSGLKVEIVRGREHERYQLLIFGKLIEDGFLERLEQQLQEETSTFRAVVEKVESFLSAR